MRMRRLSLQRETLTTLATDDLARVAGGAAHTTPILQCVLSEVCTYINAEETAIPCRTNPCTTT